jgi:putative hydroxymethylpyrimidine transport system substrate-binding protein
VGAARAERSVAPVSRRHWPLVVALAAVAALAGCGERSEPTSGPRSERLSLMLDYLPNADHAGIYAARARGDFRRAGLDVDVQTPSDPSAPLKLLAAGRVDLAISYEPELLLARDAGEKLVAVGALVQEPLTSIMSVGRRGVRDPAALRGKTVGTAGIPYQSAYLKAVLEQARVDPGTVKEVNVGFNLVPAMLSGKVGATLGAFWNIEGVQLRLARKDPQIIRIERAGVPTYDELVIVAREADLGTGGARVRRFLRALGQGHVALRRDPEAGVRPLLAANRDLDARAQLESVKATLPAFFPPAGKPFGWMDRVAWARYGRWMYERRLLRRPPAITRALTEEFLPGEGPVSEDVSP